MGYQIAQTAHSVAAFAFSKTEEFRHWHQNSQYIVNLCVNDEASLHQLLEEAENRGLNPIPFREPDLLDALTSIALVPHKENRKFLANLPLAGKKHGNVNGRSKKGGSNGLSS